jgi:hypothetical protein
MRSIALAAGRDYNGQIEGLKEGSTEFNIDTIVSVVHCGVGRQATVERKVVNSSVNAVTPIKDGSYDADGHATPLFKSIEELISMMEGVPDANDPEVSFVLQIITDGGENVYNASQVRKVVTKMAALMRTDRWTFSFRVPRGEKAGLVGLGIPGGNILEWDQTEAGMKQATASNKAATRSFYAARASGAKSTDKFYTDLSEVSLKEVKAALVDISKQVDVYVVDARNDDVQIRDFVQAQGVTYTKGCAFYELSKTETVQDYKQIAVRDKNSGAVYSGFAARDLLGLPHSGDAKVAPGAHGQYEIFVQSTSFNRKLKKGTNLMIWVGATV